MLNIRVWLDFPLASHSTVGLIMTEDCEAFAKRIFSQVIHVAYLPEMVRTFAHFSHGHVAHNIPMTTLTASGTTWSSCKSW